MAAVRVVALGVLLEVLVRIAERDAEVTRLSTLHASAVTVNHINEP